MMRRFAAWVTLFALLPCTVYADWQHREAAVMGTRIAVEAWHDDAAVAGAAIDAVMAEMHRVDALMSHYKPESQLSRVNREAAAGPVPVAPELAALIARALEFSELTGGAFDISYASVGYLYEYREHRRPTEAEIEAALPAVDWRSIEVDRQASTVRFLRPGMRIDLGGIAKGYAVDRGIAILRAHGVAHGTVTAGGDSGILGDRRGRPWVVGIRHPDDPDRVIARIPLEDAAISTSGDYERYFEEGGVRYHHILNPRTGRSAAGVRSATVIGPDATLTDGLSTSLFVLGVERGLALVNAREDVDAVIVRDDGRVFYSKGLEPPRDE
ncbi:MAG: FAD:protein FMN transferase [Steroidobacteraceae bacterium]|nr:FAD:protein FMN transferase [Steroidobacteraceae bacterium]